MGVAEAAFYSNISSGVEKGKSRWEVGKNYRGTKVRKGDQGSSTLHMFLSFSVVILFIDLTN
jgi:hypothetical protein